MLFRFLYSKNNIFHYENINSKLNKFIEDENFFIDLYDFYYSNFHIKHYKKNNDKLSMKYIYENIKKINYINSLIKDKNEIDNIVLKYPFVLYCNGLDNYYENYCFKKNKELLLSSYKDKQILLLYKNYTYHNFPLIPLDDHELLFHIIKNINHVINNVIVNIDIFKNNKIFLNFISRKFSLKFTPRISEIIKKFNYQLQFIKNNSDNIYKIDNEYFTKSFEEFCLLKYGTIKNSLINDSKRNLLYNKYIHSIKYFTLYDNFSEDTINKYIENNFNIHLTLEQMNPYKNFITL